MNAEITSKELSQRIDYFAKKFFPHFLPDYGRKIVMQVMISHGLIK